MGPAQFLTPALPWIMLSLMLIVAGLTAVMFLRLARTSTLLLANVLLVMVAVPPLTTAAVLPWKVLVVICSVPAFWIAPPAAVLFVNVLPDMVMVTVLTIDPT